MALTYFAQDGSYGDASGLIVLDTRAWNAEQWDSVELASDYKRAGTALEVAARNGDI
jgi:alpha-L-fucosidase